MEPRLRDSPEQFAVLVEFMERDGDLAKPHLDAQGRLKSNEKWQELPKINSVGGGVFKPVNKWKKCGLTGRKRQKKHLNIRKHASGTVQQKVLTTLEEIYNNVNEQDCACLY